MSEKTNKQIWVNVGTGSLTGHPTTISETTASTRWMNITSEMVSGCCAGLLLEMPALGISKVIKCISALALGRLSLYI